MNIWAKYFLISSILCSTAASASDYPFKTGERLPEALGRELKKGDLKLDMYHGKVLVVSFWASWCAPCRKELPLLASIKKQVSDEEMAVVAISYNEKKRDVLRFQRQLKDSGLVFSYDGGGLVADSMGVKAIPHTLIVDREGRLVYRSIGYSEDTLDQLVNALNTEFAKPKPVGEASP